MRLFIGIPLAPEAVNAMESLCRMLRSHRSDRDSLRWTSPEAWHITLQFLGSVGPEAYECTVSQLDRRRFPPLEIQIDAPGFFDGAGILYAGVKLTSELLTLHRRVGAATHPCGFLSESRPYHPHITLARSKGRKSLHKLHLPPMEETAGLRRFTASEILLYESFTEPEGSRYEVRRRFPLCGE